MDQPVLAHYVVPLDVALIASSAALGQSIQIHVDQMVGQFHLPVWEPTPDGKDGSVNAPKGFPEDVAKPWGHWTSGSRVTGAYQVAVEEVAFTFEIPAASVAIEDLSQGYAKGADGRCQPG